MTLAAPPSTAADRRALANFSANLAALASIQPFLAAGAVPPRDELEWVFGRDGCLTARDAMGQWWSGCSLPRRAAAAMLKKMDVRAPVTCFLAPPHAAHVRTALDKLSAGQAVVALCPEEADLRLILACEDFSNDLAAHRLWFVAGPSWTEALFDLYDKQIGLAIPSQFLRLPLSDEKIIERLIVDAQSVFSRLVNQRSEQLNAACRAYAGPTGDRRKLCIMSPSHFRQWNDEGYVLRNAALSMNAVTLDTDDPASASPLQLATSACECDAFLAPNFARADLSGALPRSLPWLTWITNGRIPRFDLAAERDRLLISDAMTQRAAIAAGWPAGRIHLAAWPQRSVPHAPVDGSLSVLADTLSLETPADLEGFSSHRVLWEFIRDALLKDPFAIDGDMAAYLTAQMRRFDVSADGFPIDRFIHRLILPAYQQALVRLLLEAGLPVRLYGIGWGEIAELRQHAAGAIGTREDFEQALAVASILVHIWPSRLSHPIDAVGRPVIRRTGRRPESFVRDAKVALNAPPRTSVVEGPALSASHLDAILKSIFQ